MKKNRPNELINRVIETERKNGKDISIRSIAIKSGLNYVKLNEQLKNNDWNPTFETLEKIGDALGYSFTIRAEKRKEYIN